MKNGETRASQSGVAGWVRVSSITSHAMPCHATHGVEERRLLVEHVPHQVRPYCWLMLWWGCMFFGGGWSVGLGSII